MVDDVLRDLREIASEKNVFYSEAIEILKIVELRRINETLGDLDHERTIW